MTQAGGNKALLLKAQHWAADKFKSEFPGFKAGNVYQHEPCTDGTLVFYIRFEKKGINGDKSLKETRPFNWREEKFQSGYTYLQTIKDNNGKLPPFTGISLNNPAPVIIDPSRPLFIVEGHKQVAFLRGLGIQAITSGSASTFNSVDLSAIQNHQDIRAWPDHDDRGVVYAIKMVEICRSFKNLCRFIDPKTLGLDEHGDVIDWCQLNPKATAADILALPLLDIIENPEPPDPEHEWDPISAPGELYGPDLSPDFLSKSCRDFARALSIATLVPVGAPILQVLSALSTALQGKFIVKRNNDHIENLVVWTLGAMESGTKKSKVVNAAIAPIAEHEIELHESMKDDINKSELKRKLNEKIINKLLDKASNLETSQEDRAKCEEEANELKKDTPKEMFPPKLFTGDTTPETLQSLLYEQFGRMSILSSEGVIFEIMGGLYSKNGAVNLDVFLQAYTGERLRIYRKDREVVLERSALTIGLLIQPTILQNLGSGKQRKFKDMGVMGRFFYFIPENTVGTRDLSVAISTPDGVKGAYHALMHKLLNIEAEVDLEGSYIPQEITMSEEAHTLFNEYAQEIEYSQAEGGRNRGVMTWASKIAGGSMRVAGLLCVTDFVELGKGADALEITGDQMRRAIGFCRELEPHAHIAFKTAGMTRLTENTKVVYKWIVRNGEADFLARLPKEAYPSRFDDDPSAFDSVITALIKRNIIGPEIKVKTKGRPAVKHEVNPAVFSNEGEE